MKNAATRAAWGIMLVLFGLALAGRAFGLLEFELFFKGWWTLFIIIPCAIGLSEPEKRTSSLVGLGIGIILLLWSQGIFEWYKFGRMMMAFVFVVIGLMLITRGNNNKAQNKFEDKQNGQKDWNQGNWNQTDNNQGNYKQTDYNQENYNQTNNQSEYNQGSNNQDMYNQDMYNENMHGQDMYSQDIYSQDIYSHTYGDTNENNNNTHSNYTNNRNSGYGSTNHGEYNHITGILSGRNIQYIDEVFTGAVISSILGNVQLDLRNAIFTKNATVNITCILGGVDFFIPPNVKVVVNCTPILAGVDNNIISPINSSSEMYTLFINGTCILGGIDVK